MLLFQISPYYYIGSGPQSGVRNNGPTFNNRITFTARDVQTVMVAFNVSDDSVARENLESYTVGLSNPSMTGVNIASSTNVRISDNDGNESVVCVSQEYLCFFSCF